VTSGCPRSGTPPATSCKISHDGQTAVTRANVVFGTYNVASGACRAAIRVADVLTHCHVVTNTNNIFLAGGGGAYLFEFHDGAEPTP
jgi:hypothetical protein